MSTFRINFFLRSEAIRRNIIGLGSIRVKINTQKSG